MGYREIIIVLYILGVIKRDNIRAIQVTNNLMLMVIYSYNVYLENN